MVVAIVAMLLAAAFAQDVDQSVLDSLDPECRESATGPYNACRAQGTSHEACWQEASNIYVSCVDAKA
jgi:hypothetical protein